MATKFEVKTVVPSVIVTLRRRNHEGLGDGLWFYDFSWNGARHRGATKRIVEREAREVARAAVEEVARVVPSEHAGLTLRIAIDACMNTRWPKPVSPPPPADPIPDNRKSIRGYCDALNRLDAFANFSGETSNIGGSTADEMQAMIQRYVDHRHAQKKSPQTIHNDRTVISRLCSWLIGRKMVQWSRNPAAKTKDAGIDAPKIERRAGSPLTQDDVDVAITLAKTSNAYPAVILCLSGLRPRGACRVCWTHIDLKARRVRVLEKSRERVIPLSEWATAELTEWRLQHPPASDDSTIISTQSVLYKWLRKAGLGAETGKTLYAMRRTFLHRLFVNGVSPQLAAKLAGNSIQTIQKHYVNMEAMDATAIVDVLDFSKKPATPSHKESHDGEQKAANA